ncbi:MAG TPA: cupin domain-containing protein [Stellaceae bacterium]|nr:cupin domain-containing protein [Stellaceae bacterium]
MSTRILQHPKAVGLAAGAGLVLAALLLWNGRLPSFHEHAPAMASMAPGVPTTSTIISSHAIPDMPGKQMTAVIVDFPPGAVSPEHHHEGSLTVYVLKGTIRSQLAGEPPQVYTVGQSFFEPLGSVHLLAENMSKTEPARILAVFVHDKGARLTVYH